MLPKSPKKSGKSVYKPRGEGVPDRAFAHEIKQSVIQNREKEQCCLEGEWCVYTYADISRVSNTTNEV